MTDNEKTQSFDPSRVKPMPGQPRIRFKRIQELAASIKRVGQRSPGEVTLIEGDPNYDAQLVDGERRLRACQIAGVKFRAVVTEKVSDAETFRRSFAANFGKQDHDCIEIAGGLARLQDDGSTILEMAEIAGRSAAWVSQHLSLMKLHPDVRAMMASEDDEPPQLALMLGLLLVPLPQDEQLAMAKRITKGQGMSLAAARRMILRERAEAGDTKAYSSRMGRSVSRIESICEDFGDRIGVYLDMPGPEFAALIDTVDHADKRRLVELLRDKASDLNVMADVVFKRLPKIGQKRAG